MKYVENYLTLFIILGAILGVYLLLNNNDKLTRETAIPDMKTESSDFAKGQLIVKVKEGVELEESGLAITGKFVATAEEPGIGSLNKLNQKFGVTKIEKLFSPKLKDNQGLSRVYLLRLPISADIRAVAKEYEKNPWVEYAEPNYIGRTTGIPNDPLFSSQWGMTKIKAPEAWDLTHGSSSVKIAILDSGIGDSRFPHPDLSSKVVASTYFTGGSAGANDWYGHGTGVAGIAGAITNNAVGIAGVGFDSNLMNVKVLDNSGGAFILDVANGIRWAVDNGAKVISISWGTSVNSPTLQSAVDYAWSNNIVVVVAAGNSPGGSSNPSYPAAFANSIAVAGTDPDDELYVNSHFGDWVDVAAPGTGIQSTTRTGSYGSFTGTSFAAPFVSGLAALLFPIVSDTNGDGRVNDEIKFIIESTSNDTALDLYAITSGKNIAHGRIDAYAAVFAALSGVSLPDTTPPVRSNGLPMNVVGSRDVVLSLVTDELATCKYSATAGLSYGSMPNTFSITGGLSHSKSLTLSDSGSYSYYVRCIDAVGNVNTNDYAITFSVDVTRPSFSIQYYSDFGLALSLGNNPRLVPGTYYVKVTSTEALVSAPLVSINAEGSANDVANAAASLVSGYNYRYTRTVVSDPLAVGVVKEDFSVTGTDALGNVASNVDPWNEPSAAAYTVAAVVADVVPPVRSGGLPVGVVGGSVVLSLVTDESATCKYSVTAGLSYGSMPNTFSITEGLSHSQSLTLSSGSYSYYVRCVDVVGNANLNDYVITFSVDVVPPVTLLASVEGDVSLPYSDVVDDGNTDVVFSGENSMMCRWYVSDVAYDPGSGTACIISGSQGTCTIPTTSGSYTRYVSCADSIGNRQQSSQNLDVSWTVDIVPVPPPNNPPSWSNFVNNSSASYSYPNVIQFNATWSDDHDNNAFNTAIFEDVTSHVNFTASRQPGTNKSTINLAVSAGFRCYKFYANDSSNAFASTNQACFTIQTADPRTNMFRFIDNATANKTVTYPATVEFRGNETNKGDGDLTYKCYINDTNFGSGSNCAQSILLIPGIYEMIYNTTGGANYTAGQVRNLFLTVIGVPPVDSIAPLWSNSNINSTTSGTAVDHSVVLSDNIALNYYIFEFDNGTSTLSNMSTLEILGAQVTASQIVKINSTPGTTIRWRYYFNDTSGNWNKTSLFSYVTTPGIIESPPPVSESPPPAFGGGGGGIISIGEKKESPITKEIEEIESEEIEEVEGIVNLELIAPDTIESGELYNVTVKLSSPLNKVYTLVVGNIQQQISLEGEEKIIDFTLRAPEAKGIFTITASVEGTTKSKNIYLDYLPLFLYANETKIENGVIIDLSIKNYEPLSTELRVIKDNKQDVFIEVVDGQKEYTRRLKLTQPGDYKIVVTASSSQGIVDVDEQLFFVEGEKNSNYWVILVVVPVFFATVITLAFTFRRVI